MCKAAEAQHTLQVLSGMTAAEEVADIVHESSRCEQAREVGMRGLSNVLGGQKDHEKKTIIEC